MKKKLFTRTLSLGVGAALLCGASAMLFTACSKISNESTPLTLSSNPLDGVFNPFFYTSGDDGEVVGYTQVGLLSGDNNGKPVAGKDEMSVALDYSVVQTGSRDNMANDDDYSNFYTDYYFAIKNGLKFSDGHDLTIKDVLFNLYMYLDPAYTGSSTMYSVDIQGLAAYRTQTEDKNQQEQFDTYFDNEAQTRINAIRNWANDKNSTWDSASEEVQKDILLAHDYFKDELNADWNSAQNTDMKEYEKYGFKEGWEVFLFNYGSAGGITVTPERGEGGKVTGYKVDYNGTDKMAHDKDTLINYIHTGMVGSYLQAPDSYKTNIYNLVSFYATANALRQDIKSQEITEHFKGELRIRTIKGVTVDRKSSIPTQNGPDRDLGEECDILKIRINGVDPKAIQNFSFTVAPMHYYAPEEAEKFSLVKDQEYFGVKFADNQFMTSVKTNQVPLGAGPYRASTSRGTSATDKIAKTDFFKDNIVYMERNDNFMLGAPKIKNLCLKVTSSTLLYEAVRSGEVHYAMPTATKDMMDKLNGQDSKTLDYVLTENLGYGYIGINASFIKDLPVRQAIMHAMNTELVMDYYNSSDLVEMIYRPMSKTLKDYYPKDATAYYEFDETGETSAQLVRNVGYTIQNGVLTKGNTKLKFTFTVAGESNDHPAYATLNHAAEILNNIGFDITVTNDSTALSKLATGGLAVWAAAWSSSSDPDMYQVYHKKSSATSILNWGFPYLMADGTSAEKTLINDLATAIEKGREYLTVGERKPHYDNALDMIMELAVELPTYQRKNLYVYQSNILDDSTFYQEASAYSSPLTKIWEVSFKESN